MPGFYPVKSATIHAAVATAIVPLRRPLRGDDQFEMVESLEDAERAKGFTAEGDEHHCPLCNEFFNYTDFARHAPQCIRLRAPKWERSRDEEPLYHVREAPQKQFRPKLFGPGG